MANPDDERETSPHYAGRGKPLYQDVTAEDASTKKGASFNADQSQPSYIYSRRWEEYR